MPVIGKSKKMLFILSLFVLVGCSIPNVNGNRSIDSTLEMHVIDVGQGDAILFVEDDNVMLVDGGDLGKSDIISNYLTNLGIDEIDVLVGTHPHSDHMGNFDIILDNFDVSTLYVPDILDENITTQWYLRFLKKVDEIDSKRNSENSIWQFPKDENGNFRSFDLGNIHVQMISPKGEKYSNANNYSIGMKVSFGETDILLTGDAEKLVEKEILESNFDLNCEVMKSAHHGSNTSNSREFLEAVGPEYIVISVGYANRYEHPIRETMDLYKELHIPVYRTDENGTIIMTTDGKNISFDSSPGDYLSGIELEQQKEEN